MWKRSSSKSASPKKAQAAPQPAPQPVAQPAMTQPAHSTAPYAPPLPEGWAMHSSAQYPGPSIVQRPVNLAWPHCQGLEHARCAHGCEFRPCSADVMVFAVLHPCRSLLLPTRAYTDVPVGAANRTARNVAPRTNVVPAGGRFDGSIAACAGGR
jgi:hypothetical protein